MTGIDAVTAAMLASRIDSLLEGGVSAGAPATQVGIPTGAARGAPPTNLPLPAPSPPAPSAQTALSSVALTLDAISRHGGDATPVVVGKLPLLDAPPALVDLLAGDGAPAAGAAAQAGGAAATAANAAGANAAPGTAATANAAGATGTADGAQAAAPLTPSIAQAAIAALAAALARSVADSGLFYESHLAQWLAGQRGMAELAREPQNQLTQAAAREGGASPGGAAPRGAAADGGGATPAGAGGGAAPDAPSARPPAAGQFGASGALAYASQAAEEGASRLLAATASQPGAALGGDANGANGSAAMATVNPATLPLVRQQLDLLATQQFRWSGEAWPGARLDWSVEPDAGGTQPGEAPLAWRTRLMLSLPTLGAVDAELVLTGSQLVARLRANDAGAARLSAHGEALRQRLQASGLELGGLTIRAVDSVPDPFDSAASRAAAAAYEQGQAHAQAGAARPAAKQHDLGDFDDIDEFGFLDDGLWR
ncbi:flagellar hook-length control protein FliK [Burkholderia gladioli]|uniref:flagellar hook-length control protein FliK n=3 Tax=Burkholderia gladioli TaxID=28095 RepID=UPI001640D2E0|nr:flagellar hook-length control protein FliK [Burkholderia gladioli]